MRILSVIETQPQLIKAAVLSSEIRELDEEIVVYAGSRKDYEAKEELFESLDISKPKYVLDVAPGTSSEEVGGTMMKLGSALQDADPDVVLAFGDDNKTLGAALGAKKMGYPVAHIEAGLRSFDQRMQEEMNRVLIDHLSDILFCPTPTSVDNLAREGITKNVFLVGDVMVDALMFNSKVALQRSNILGSLQLSEKSYVISSIHTAMNIQNEGRMKAIVSSMISSGERIVFPMNRKTEKMLRGFNMMEKVQKAPNILITKPLEYVDFIRLMMGAKKVITDSGGIQKEAYVLKVPCITVRESTEWMETVQDGWNVLVGADEQKIKEAVAKFDPSTMQKSSFGDGKASIKIARILHEGLKELVEGPASERSG